MATNQKVGIIIVEGETIEDEAGFFGFPAWLWHGYLHARQEDIDEDQDTYLELWNPEGRNLSQVLAEAKDLLFEEGYTHYEVHQDEKTPVRHILPATKKRLLARAEVMERAKRQRRIAANLAVRRRRAGTLVTRMAHPTPSTIRLFFKNWDSRVFRDVLSQAKAALLHLLIHHAQREGWVYGHRVDQMMFSRCPYNDVLYIDTPEGQASFHFLPGSLGDIPDYSHPWSRLRDTAKIVERLARGRVLSPDEVVAA